MIDFPKLKNNIHLLQEDFFREDYNNESTLIYLDKSIDYSEHFVGEFKYKSIAIGKTNNCLEEITSSLNSSSSRINDLHLVAHGNNEGISIGGYLLNNEFLISNIKLLANWKIENLYLWSCEIGKNKNLLSLFSELTSSNSSSSF